MKQLCMFIIIIAAIILCLSPLINPRLAQHDLLIMPMNIVKMKRPIVRSMKNIQVSKLNGDVMLLRDEVTRHLKVGEKVVTDDVIYVRESAFLVLEFGFGSKLQIPSNTKARINNIYKRLESLDRSKISTYVWVGGNIKQL